MSGKASKMDLLLELFSEEIPAALQRKAADDLARLVSDALVDHGITYHSKVQFSTSRRLFLGIFDILEKTKDIKEERKGPRLDAPQKAIDGFLRATGLTKDALEIREDKKGATYFAIIEKKGREVQDIIAEVVPDVIRSFPWSKSMRWGAGNLRWIRPLRSILCVLASDEGAHIVPFQIDDLTASNITYGHRFHAPDPIEVTGFEQYIDSLKRAYVMIDPDDREKLIHSQATHLAFAQGLEMIEDKKLLREIAGLVEHPVTLMGKIDEKFMTLPKEVLQVSMKTHQKFLSVENPESKRIEKFITVVNIETSDKGATILAGNEKVLSARLSDAKFFWENDLNTPLDAMAEKLAHVTFHHKLGSVHQQTLRIADMAEKIAPLIGADAPLTRKAALLAKADIVSEMVYEFPELQGVMGQYYADAAHLPHEIGLTSAKHRSPLGPSDDVPRNVNVVAVALADKIDLLASFWAINEKPTGSKDPFALRRAALGVIRLILENDLSLKLRDLCADSYDADMDDLMRFLEERFKIYLRDKGLSHDVIDACLAQEKGDFRLITLRARALQEFLSSDDGENLKQGYKRAVNILSAEEEKDGVFYELDPDITLAKTDEERALFKALAENASRIDDALLHEKWHEAMHSMANLRKPIDDFFETTHINAPLAIVRRNRLCLLNQIRQIIGKVAEFSKLHS